MGVTRGRLGQLGQLGQLGRPEPGRGPARREPAVTVEIGELVVDGFDHRVDPDLVSAAFRRELDRLIRLRGVPSRPSTGGNRRVGALTGLPPLPATTSPVRLGTALARAVHAGLSGEGRAR